MSNLLRVALLIFAFIASPLFAQRISVTSTAQPIVVSGTSVAYVEVRETPDGAAVAFHTGATDLCSNARTANEIVRFTGPFSSGQVAGYIKLDTSATQSFTVSEVTTTPDQRVTKTPVTTPVDGEKYFNSYSSATGAFGKAQPSKTTVGLANVTNDAQVKRTEMGVALGVSTLDAAAKIPVAQLPPIAIVDYLGSVASQVAMLALVGQQGDWCIRSDQGKVYIAVADDLTQLASWVALAYPADAVLSVNGHTGVVALTKSDVGLANADNTSDANKPVSTATQTQLDLKAPLVSPSFTTPVLGVASGTSLALRAISSVGVKVFTGAGLNDATFGGTYLGSTNASTLTVIVDGVNGIKTATLGAGGTNYALNDTFTVNTGGVLATGKVLTLSGSAVATFSITSVGSGYSVANGVATTATSGIGTGLTINVTALNDSFKWQKDSGAFTSKVAMTGAAQSLQEGVQITFAAIVGHTLTDQWVSTVTVTNPLSVQNAAGTTVLRADNNGQVNLYNPATDATNYERVSLDWFSDGANAAALSTSKGGTGVLRDLALDGAQLRLSTSGNIRWWVSTGGMFYPWADNTYDIGLSNSANRPRNVYVSNSVDVGGGKFVVNSSGVPTAVAGVATVGSGVPFVPCVFAGPVSAGADTTEDALWICTVPAAAIGVNGSLKVEFNINTTGVAGSKVVRFRLGTSACTVGATCNTGTAYLAGTVATTSALAVQSLVSNQNSASAQVGFTTGWASGGSTASFYPSRGTSAIDTASAFQIAITCAKGNSADVCTLEGVTVAVVKN